MTRGTTNRRVSRRPRPGWCSSAPLGNVGDRSIFVAHEGRATTGALHIDPCRAEVSRLFGQETGLDLENLDSLGSRLAKSGVSSRIVLFLRYEDGAYLRRRRQIERARKSVPSEEPYRYLRPHRPGRGSSHVLRSGNPTRPPESGSTDERRHPASHDPPGAGSRSGGAFAYAPAGRMGRRTLISDATARDVPRNGLPGSHVCGQDLARHRGVAISASAPTRWERSCGAPMGQWQEPSRSPNSDSTACFNSARARLSRSASWF
jgi:hypothetical protein